jgi:thiol-disulfide isomerase/thioredoxin
LALRACRSRVFAVTCLALLVAGGMGACGERTTNGFKPGQAFPAVALASLAGHDQAAPDSPPGGARLVNFWATWCEPCRKEMPSLERLHRMADPTKLSVIGISVDSDLNLAREFLLQLKLTFPNYSDREQKLARAQLNIQAFPVTFLVAADGSVKACITGMRDWASAETLHMLEHTLGDTLVSR